MGDGAKGDGAGGGAERGRQADSPVEVPLLGWKEIALRSARVSSKDNIALVAAGVAFYGFLALVPLLAAIVLIFGLVASPDTVVKSLGALTGVLPTNVAQLIGDMLLNVIHSSGGRKGFGILIALAVATWGARNAAGSVIVALNIAYEEEEKRGFVARTLLALAMTAGAVVLALAGVAAMAALTYLAHLFPGSSRAVRLIGRLVTYPLLLLGAAGGAATVYRYGPSRERAKWTWITPGSLFAAVGWLLLTVGFGLYVTNVAHYDVWYGSLGSVVALLTWMYLSSYVFLFGAELNSEVEHQTAKDTTAGGERPIGERGAWSADHVADGVGDEGKERAGGSPSPLADTAKPEDAETPPAPLPPGDHAYLASRVASRGARMAGLAKVGMVSSALSTTGLAMLRKRGRARAGIALLAVAAGLALWKRESPPED
ncbi:MAG: YihY/virulence factor BrkB family protein [Sphingomicrobium sp.]